MGPTLDPITLYRFALREGDSHLAELLLPHLLREVAELVEQPRQVRELEDRSLDAGGGRPPPEVRQQLLDRIYRALEIKG